MDMCDIVNEFNKPTGNTATIRDVHENGLRHRTAQIWVYNGESILLCRRDDSVFAFPGYYDCVGGHVDAHEYYMDAALRELEEETGIKASMENMYLLFRIYSDTTNEYEKSNKEFSYVYLLFSDLEDFKKNEEVSDILWRKYTDFKCDMLNGSDIKYIPRGYDYRELLIKRIEEVKNEKN